MKGIRCIAVLLGLGTAMVFAPVVSAQEGGREGRRGGGFGGFGFTMEKPTLLGSDQVRKEVKITDDQVKKLDEILAAHREGLRGTFSGPRSPDSSEAERAKAREESRAKSAELLKKTNAALAEVLTKDQAKRLDEILLQQQGSDALVAENVVASLSLSKEQTEKIRGVLANRDAELGKLRPSGRGRGGDGAPGAGAGAGGNFEELRGKMTKVRQDADSAALAVLTKDQAEALAKLKGTAFELDRNALFGGGRGRGGAGGGGGGGQRGGGGDRRRPAADDEV